MKVYAGAPAAARQYVEAGGGRADDYYLAEGTGIARRFVAAGGQVEEVAPLTGDGYEAWVAGIDPDSGSPRGRVRTDDRAVRFCEVVVNGPKSWSLAAALHPDIAAAHDAAQDRAAAQIISWLAENSTTRVGPRGDQVQVPVEVLEAVTVRHFSSRAGDPHRHLHLQVNARVFASHTWRGLHSVGVRDSLAAINGVGHAAVATDPAFRAALAAYGFTLNSDGEIAQLASYVGAFSTRAAQITRNVAGYESEWTASHPGERPGPALRRSWDARAWADGRPDKVMPLPGEDLDARWLTELAALGYRDRDQPIKLLSPPVGGLDRDAAVRQVLHRLGAARSAWNTADVRGAVEHLIASSGFVLDAAVRIELAEDLTARAVHRCVPLVVRDGAPVPAHIRALTSRPVLAVEADLTERFAARTIDPSTDTPLGPSSREGALDQGQARAAEALAGDRRLLVVEGAAGAGKTTTLAATRSMLDRRGHGLMVVTPTLKAATVASAEIGAATGSAAWLAFQHGWRWSPNGQWTRLTPGQTDESTGRIHRGPKEAARLAAGDLLVVDEAGMLDQDTARALVTIADESGARLALVGDRHQLAAVGRGGVLDLAIAQIPPSAHLELQALHRFTRTDPMGRIVSDTEYSDLTLAMRSGQGAGRVFDALAARGQIRLHDSDAALHFALATVAAQAVIAGERVAVAAGTGEQIAELNAATRQQLIASHLVDDTHVITTGAGQRIGVGDRIATRRNDPHLQVANRDTWSVTAVSRDGSLTVEPAAVTPGSAPRRAGVTPAEGSRVLPADYTASLVQLAYASTVHGVQGDTMTHAHTVLGEHTGAAAAYVGMTRGRESNTAHLVAPDLRAAKETWIAVFRRDRADLGPTHAAARAAREAAQYSRTPASAHEEHLKAVRLSPRSEVGQRIAR